MSSKLWPDEAASSMVNSAIVDCEEIKERAQREQQVEITTEAEAAVSALEDLMAAINAAYDRGTDT